MLPFSDYWILQNKGFFLNSHIFNLLLKSPLTNIFPSFEKQIDFNDDFKVQIVRPVWTFQILMVSSKEPLIKIFPSGEKQIEVTSFECPFNVFSSLKLATSHILMDLSQVLAILVQSFENLTEVTQLKCPLKVFSNVPLWKSQSLMLLSSDAVTILKSSIFITLFTKLLCAFSNSFFNIPSRHSQKRSDLS